MTDEEWKVLEPLLPTEGRPRDDDLREAANGVRHVLSYGVPWDATPKDLPPWWVLYAWFRSLAGSGVLPQTHHLLLVRARERAGREATPGAAILDSRTVKRAAPAGARGYDGAKKMLGRRQPIALGTGGRLLDLIVTTIDVPDQDAGLALAGRVALLCPWVETVIAGGTCKETFRRGVGEVPRRQVEMVDRPDALHPAAGAVESRADIRRRRDPAPAAPRLRGPCSSARPQCSCPPAYSVSHLSLLMVDRSLTGSEKPLLRDPALEADAGEERAALGFCSSCDRRHSRQGGRELDREPVDAFGPMQPTGHRGRPTIGRRARKGTKPCQGSRHAGRRRPGSCVTTISTRPSGTISCSATTTS